MTAPLSSSGMAEVAEVAVAVALSALAAADGVAVRAVVTFGPQLLPPQLLKPQFLAYY
jgi:hypothetical protein